MNKLGSLASVVIFLVLLCGRGSAWTDVVGLANKHLLTESQIGELLIEELRCASCHKSEVAQAERLAPDLSNVGGRVKHDYLRRFIVNPSAVHPGSSMPDVLASVPEAARGEFAEALTHFLVSQSTKKFHSVDLPQPDLNTGKELYHSVGCVACHAPREVKTRQLTREEQAREDEKQDSDPIVGGSEARKTGVVELSHAPSKYSQSTLSEFLFQPLKIRSDGRMPDMKLTTAEAQAIAGYLLSGELGLSEQQGPIETLEPQASLVELGKKYFAELNCAACHRLGDTAAKPLVVSLRKANLSQGCLSTPANGAKVDKVETQMKSPQYLLSDSQVNAIRAALTTPDNAIEDQTRIAITLAAFNCIACHVRDDFGGVAEDRSAYFETSEKNLGDDGRIPPPLTLLGAKLRPEWLRKVLFDGESVRPYMATRMPQFGEANLKHLPELVSRVDKLESEVLDIPSPESDTREKTKDEREREKLLRTAGRELLGQQGVYCVACHNFNGKPAPVNKGIDLMTTFERLQPGWFNNFVRNPGKYRPRIIMPYSWPDGVAAHNMILDGNTQMQIEAIWYYLSLGTSAAEPSGIRRVDTVLSVADTARTYRGRSSVAGFRGIAVGFPERLSYAFNAETGTLSAIWQGDFIRVDRGGQGSGGFNPSAPPIQLPQDVSFVDLKDNTLPWPLRPVMTKEAPVNPDPLYPKNHGYQFKGYYFDDSQVPTFMYRSNEIEIEDRSVAVRSENALQLVRSIQFNSPTQGTVWFRALAGTTDSLKTVSKGIFETDKLRLIVPAVPTVLRSAPDDAKQPGVKRSELLLRIDVPQGHSNLTMTYEPLK